MHAAVLRPFNWFETDNLIYLKPCWRWVFVKNYIKAILKQVKHVLMFVKSDCPSLASSLGLLLLWASWMGEQPPKPLREVKAFGSHKPRSIELLQKKCGTKPNYAKLFCGSRLCFHPSFSASFFFFFYPIFEIPYLDSCIHSFSYHPPSLSVRCSFDIFLKLVVCMCFIIRDK